MDVGSSLGGTVSFMIRTSIAGAGVGVTGSGAAGLGKS
jgi:hypothetical protein